MLKRAEESEKGERELRTEHQRLQEELHSATLRCEFAESEMSALSKSLDGFKEAPHEADAQHREVILSLYTML